MKSYRRRRAKKAFLRIVLILAPTLLLKDFTETVGVLLGFDLISSDMANSFYHTYCDLVLGRSMKEGENFMNSVFNVAPSIVFMVAYGTFIYSDMNGSGIYLLTRYRNRRCFLLQKTKELIQTAVVYTAFQVAYPWLLAELMVKEAIGPEHALIVLITFLELCLFNLFSAYLVNILSVRLGMGLGFFVAYAVLLVSYRLEEYIVYPAAYLLPTALTVANRLDESNSYFAYVNSSGQFISMASLAAYFLLLLLIGGRVLQTADIGLVDRDLSS